MRVRDAPLCEQSAITVVHNVRELAGAIVYDCRPPLLPVSIPLHDFQCSPVGRPVAPSNLAVAPAEETDLEDKARVCLSVAKDDFTASGLRRRASGVSVPVFGATTACSGWLSWSSPGGERTTDT